MAALRARAYLLAEIRSFLTTRGVMAVETPLLCPHTVTDPHIHSLSVPSHGFLQTSPEYAMKRLLAAGSGPIYQLCKAFRAEESGTLHHHEFSLLEWYEPGLTHLDLMAAISTCLTTVANLPPAVTHTYAEIFSRYCKIDVFSASIDTLRDKITQVNNPNALGRDDCLSLLFATHIEPHLGHDAPCFITNYPASQAALARLCPQDPRVAERFELFINGTEIGNGFHELTDPEEQHRRFTQDNADRVARGLPEIKIDNQLIAALTAGLPPCAGVAIGLDRLMMAIGEYPSIAAVISFTSP